MPIPIFLTITLSIALPHEDHAELALDGLDPVRLCQGQKVPGQSSLTVSQGRYSYRFVDEQSRRLFQTDPERWGIQWGGGCARMGPLSGVGSPDRWTVYEGRIFIFASDNCRKGFLSAPERFVTLDATDEAESVDDQALAQGESWLERAIDAHGGAEAFGRFGGLKLLLEKKQSGWTNRVEHLLTAEGSVRRQSGWDPPDPEDDGYVTAWVLDEGAGFIDEGDATIPITNAAQMDDLSRYGLREPVSIFWAHIRGDVEAWVLDSSPFNGVKACNLRVVVQGLPMTLHLDATTARVLGLTWKGRLNTGMTRTIVEQFTRYSDLEGLLIPQARTVEVDGKPQPTLAVEWNTMRLLVDVPEDVLKKPQR